MKEIQSVLVTGGAGYVGSALVPRLLDEGYRVRVIDLYMYGDDVFPTCADHPKLEQVRGDIRDGALIDKCMEGMDAVIHLACISNDPSYDLDPDLGKSINFDAFRPMVASAKAHGVKRFVYASSSSVYGIKDDPEVTEDLVLEPLTDYSKFKAQCEQILLEYEGPTFTTTTIRPATVAGYAPRQRLDVIINIFCNLAVNKGEISIFGGAQKRPNIHIDDMARSYLMVLAAPKEKVAAKIWNVGYENHTVAQLAEMVRDVVGPQVKLTVTPTNDNRSYHVSSKKIKDDLGFEPAHTLRDAAVGLVDALKAGKLPDSLTDPKYFNIKMMQKINLK
ncbi:MAG: NAD-dependent epimerase/dehydratase [Alphaproteobacteria bacterium]|nr:NAD-dependent epimerase/dehydratase [Alphaproteobacteria bacterium]